MFRAPVDWRIFRDGDYLIGRLRDRAWRAERDARHAAMGERIRAELYPDPVLPERPVVLVRQCAAVGDQMSPGCVALIKAAEIGDWEARATYTLVTSKGKLIETCVCWLRCGRHRGHAGWERVGGGSWSFVSAWVDRRRVPWQRTKRADGTPGPPTIREILSNS